MKKKITALIPCFNEGKAIDKVIDEFYLVIKKHPKFKLEIIVIDNNSTDNTAKVARKKGVRVIHELKKGKGNAIKTGFKNVSDDTQYVVMIDGDNTYKPKELMRLIEPLDSDFCDVIIGSRLSGKITNNSMHSINRLGNWLYSFLIRLFYIENVTDVLTGYFAWKKEVIDELYPQLEAEDFSIEMEMITKMAKLKYQIYSVPITYDPRIGESNLNPYEDGKRIMKMFFKNLFWKPKFSSYTNLLSHDNKSNWSQTRIAIVSDSIYPYNKGGKEKRIFEITTRLVKKGFEVHIYCMKWWNTPEKIRIENGVYLHGISPYYPLYDGSRRSIKQAIMFALNCFKLLREPFDVVEVDHMPYFPIISVKIICLIRNKKMIAVWHEVWGRNYWRQYLGWRGEIAYLIEKIIILLPNKIISASTFTTKKIIDVLHSDKPIITIPNGIDIQSINKIKKAILKSDVIYAGRLLKHKNIDLLIKSIGIVKSDFPRVKCLIVGDGPEQKNLILLIKKMKLTKNIKLMHFVPDHKDLYGIMKASKVFVLPSNREGFGIVAIEANACGLPVITINSPDNATKNLITSTNGEVVEMDAESIANGIKKILAKKSKKQLQKCTPVIKKYDWNAIIHSYRKVYSI